VSELVSECVCMCAWVCSLLAYRLYELHRIKHKPGSELLFPWYKKYQDGALSISEERTTLSSVNVGS